MGSTKMSNNLILGAIEAAKSKKTKWVKYCETPLTFLLLYYNTEVIQIVP